jgi:hypothetical protein
MFFLFQRRELPVRFITIFPALMRLICLLLMLAGSAPSGSADIWYVSAGSQGGDGSSERPFSLIQPGVDAAMPGDTVLVRRGAYYETVKTVRAGVDSTNGTIYYIYILAAGDGPAVVKAQENFGFFIDRSHDYIWIEGFYITNGYSKTTAHGSGIRTLGDYGVFIGNRIYDNDAGFFSEGMGQLDEATNNRGNYFAYNIISNSGESAVRLKHSSENEIAFNLIYHNGYRLEPTGAIVYYCGLDNRIINNTFWDNAGVAVAAYDGTNAEECIASTGADVRDNIFARPDSGLLLSVDSHMIADSTGRYAFNLFWSPDSESKLVRWGADEFGQGGSFLTLSQFIEVARNLNPESGQGSFYADPQFYQTDENEFDLLLTSPAVDAGSVSALEAKAESVTALISQEVDVGRVDLGYHHKPMTFAVNPDVSFSDEFALYPNPYSGVGGLKFELPNSPYPRKIAGEVYNIQGQRVAGFRLPDEPLNQFLLRWDASNLADGCYFLTIRINGKPHRSKIVILK